MKSVLEYARAYIARGWLVFPLHTVHPVRRDVGSGESAAAVLICSCGNVACSDAGKHPRIAQGVKGASRLPQQIEEWFGPDAPPSNVAIATGEDSGVTVLDIDIGPNKKGDKTWAELNAEAGEPVTLMAKTGSGGLHVFFKYNSALNTSGGTLGEGIDCRNDKGYVVAAPSLHRSGGRYEWLDADAPLANLPAHLSVRKEKRGRKKKDDPTRKKYSLEQVAGMLQHVVPDDRDTWRNTGVILGREFNCADEAWAIYVEWSDTWKGKKGRNHDAIMREAFYDLSKQAGDLSLGSIIHLAISGGWSPQIGQVPKEQFLYNAPGNDFIYRPTGDFWPAESVDASCSLVNEDGVLAKPSIWLKQHALVTSITRDPSIELEVTKGFDNRDGALVEANGAALYNAYRKPTVKLGDAKLAKPFIQHVQRVFNKEGDAEMFFDYMAHRVQDPGEKPRFALLIAGQQGIGKDTAIAMCSPAIGIWNIANIEPDALEQNFNEFAASVLVVISEAANTHEMSKWAFNERTKVLIAGQPDYMRINPKYGQKFTVRLHCGVIVTTNHMTGGIYIPPDDRRYDVIESATRLEMGLEDVATRAIYFQTLWSWYTNEQGAEHIAAFLHERDLGRFNASTGQRITVAHKMVVAASSQGDDWIVDSLAALKDPPVVRLDDLFHTVETIFPGEITRQQFSSKVNHVFGRLEYRRLINPHRSDGKWHYTNDKGLEIRFIAYFQPARITLEEAVKTILKSKAAF